MFTLDQEYMNPEKNKIEIVERKGIGHPDTLADALAEELSRVYSQYCLDKYDAVLHHNLDKLYIGAGWNTNTFGSVTKIQPIKVVVNGRISDSCNGEKIDLENMFCNTIKEYLGTVLPHLNVKDDLDIIINSTQYTRVNHWFSPRTVDDVPDAKEAFANDTSVITTFYPYTICEMLAVELERYFWTPNDKGYPVPNYKEIGQDIKVMVDRIDKEINVIVCMPVISTEITSREDYYAVVQDYQCRLNDIAKRICEGTSYSVSVIINASYDNDNRGTLYILSLGTSAECGEEGLVGRGNSSRGVISTYRPNSVEAPAGKNPRYHAGRVLSFMGNRLSKAIYDQVGIKNQIVMLTRNKYSLVPPYFMNISTEQPIDREIIEKVVQKEFIDLDYTREILKQRNLF